LRGRTLARERNRGKPAKRGRGARRRRATRTPTRVGSVATLLLAAAAAPLGCGGAPPPAPKSAAYAEPHWQDVFETMPELLVVVRARAAREDRVYGPLLRRAIELAREQSRAVASARALDAMSDAEELVMGQRPETSDHPGELVLVARGVRADVDPAKLVDDEGHPLWAPGPAGAVRELVRETDEHGHPVGASLFELPGRTWIVAQGDARARAREVFAHPFNRPALALDPQALAVVRIDGPSLVGRVQALQDLGGLAAVGRHLRSVTLALPPGAEHVLRATLAYADDDSAGASEVTARTAIGALARSKKPGLEWLGSAQVEHGVKSVVLTAPLPAHLVDALLHAGSATLPLETDVAPQP
jgi:hypothetical protein